MDRAIGCENQSVSGELPGEKDNYNSVPGEIVHPFSPFQPTLLVTFYPKGAGSVSRQAQSNDFTFDVETCLSNDNRQLH